MIVSENSVIFVVITILFMALFDPLVAFGREGATASVDFLEPEKRLITLKLFSNYRKSAYYASVESFPYEKGKYETDREFNARRDNKAQEIVKQRYLFPVESSSEYNADLEVMTFRINKEQTYEYPATEDEISSAMRDYRLASLLLSFSSSNSALLYERETEINRLLARKTLLTTLIFANIKDVSIKLSRDIAKIHGDNYRVAIEGMVDINAISDKQIIATRMLIYNNKTRRVTHAHLIVPPRLSSGPQLVSIPQHRQSNEPEMVPIPGKNYEMGKYEVTQAQWRAVMGDNPSGFSGCGDDCPVEQVSWNDIQEYLKKLNAKTGKLYRLPTEAEWKHACDGGLAQEYCGSNNLDAVGWYDKNSGDMTHPVGQKQANGYGLYDMTGNVWEWVQDCWEEDCSVRVLRGGSWIGASGYARAGHRGWDSSLGRLDNNGFRVALTARSN